ncbi:unnamed protein product, partial [Coregonus sp. 'balchen']
MEDTVIADGYWTSGEEYQDGSTLREPYNETQLSPSNSTLPVEHHNSFHNTLLGLFLGFLSLLTVIMNILVLYAVKKERTLHTVGNLYIVSLSVADLIVGATVMPLNLVYLLEDEWSLGRVGWRSIATVDLKPEMENKCDTDFRFVTWFKVLASVFNFYVPSLLMLWLYSRIYTAVRQHFREREKFINPTDSVAGNRIGHKVQTGNSSCKSSNKEKKGKNSDFDQYTLDQPYDSTDTAEINTPREPKSGKDSHSSHSLLRMTKRLRTTVKEKRKSNSFQDSDSDPLNLSRLPLSFTHDDNNVQELYVSMSDIAVPPNSMASVCEITQIAGVQRHNNDFTQSLNSPLSPWPQENSDPDGGTNPDAVANAVTLKQTWQKFCVQSRKRIQILQVHKEHKAAKQLGCIIAGFMLCWIPYFIVFM